MARIIGPRGLWALSLIGLCLLIPLAVVSPLGAGLALAGAGGLSTVLAHRRARTLSARCDKLSGEVDVLSQRLLRLESVTRVLADQHLRADPAGAAPAAPASPAPDTATLAAEVEEVTAEIGLLSGIVRELAAVVAAQDGDITQLKSAPPPAPPTPTLVVPPPVAPGAGRAAAEVVPPPRRDPAPSAPTPAPWTPRTLVQAEVPPRDPAREAALIAALDDGGLEVHLQPIVSLPQRKVVSYEALARLRVAGQSLEADAFLPVLERHGRTTDLDRRMLQRVSTIARHLAGRGSPAAVSYGLSPRSLFEPGFLRSLGRLTEGEPDLSGRVVVALPQASWRSLDAEQAGVLAELRGRIGFVLDRPLDLRLDPLALADRGISQVKVPVDLLLRPGSRQAIPDIALEDLVASLARAGIRLVADRVEREADVPDLIDLDVPLAQGRVFAPARVVRAEVLSAPPAEAAEPEPAPVEAAPEPPQRRPFRDFLRRAG